MLPPLLPLTLPVLSLPPWLTSGTAITAALGLCGVVATALVAWLNGRSSQAAPLQEAVNHSVETLLKAWQTENARLSARISELEQQQDLSTDHLGDLRRDALQRDGEIAQLRQVNESLQRLLTAAGVDPIPTESALRKDP